MNYYFKLAVFKIKNKIRYNKKLITHGLSTIDRNTVFEGRNFVYDGCIIKNTTIGEGSYISCDCDIFDSKIGKYCSIGPKLLIVSGRHPSSTWVSTHPAFFSTKCQAGFCFVDSDKFIERNYCNFDEKISVEIGNDVWIGANVLILEGVKIGDGAIIAAGAVVNKDIPPYAICGGVPAKIIKYRFNNDEIEKLLKFQWWNKNFEWIQKNHIYFENMNSFNSFIEREE